MRLHTKLILSFSTIIIFMALIQSLMFQNRIETIFENYLKQNMAGSIEQLKQQLSLYYTETNSLDGAQSTFFSGYGYMRQGRGYMRGNGFLRQETEIYIVDNSGVVVGSSTGARLGEASQTLPGVREDLMVNGKKIGELYVNQANMKLLDLEQQFVDSSILSVILSGLVAALFAAIISIYTAKRILKPLEKLMTGIKRIGKGDTSYQVAIDTNDEFHDLGMAFNEMSEKLNRNEEVRKTLVADVAHELRTPLAILQGKLESIQEGATEANEQVVLELTDEVYRLNRLVNDLQQLSLAEAGKLPLNKAPADLHALIERICGHFSMLAEEKGIQLNWGNLTNPLTATIDSDRITQVIVNLIGNAIKLTPENGSITVGGYEKEGTIYIAISDTGPGIDKEHLPYLFERFYKTDKARARTDGGSGLGLSIAKGFVEAHGGTITVVSEIGQGTTFTVSIPKEPYEQSAYEAKRHPTI